MKKITSVLVALVCGLCTYAQKEVDYTSHIVNANLDSVALEIAWNASANPNYPKHPNGTSANSDGTFRPILKNYTTVNNHLEFYGWRLSDWTWLFKDGSGNPIVDGGKTTDQLMGIGLLSGTNGMVTITGAKACVMPENFEFYQIINGLPAGEYKVSCGLGVQGSDANYQYHTSQRLFANNNVQFYGKESDYPQNKTAGENYTYAGYTYSSNGSPVYAMTVYVTIAENEPLKIGIRSGALNGNGVKNTYGSLMQGFFKVDNFTLIKITDDPVDPDPTEPTSYRYNLLELLTHTGDSGFETGAPVYNLWDGLTGSGANDTKATGNTEAWVEFDFGREEEIAEAGLFQDHAGAHVTDWKVTYWTGTKWEDIFPYIATTEAGWQKKTFDITARKVRFYAKCTDGGFVSIHEIQLFTKPSTEQKKIIIGCVGDSNTEGAGSSIRGKYAWPFQLGGMLGLDYQVSNCGLGGTTLLKAADKPWVVQPQYTKHKELNSNISIIALGTNDTRAINWSGSLIFKNDYVSLIQEFQSYASHPEVIIFVPIRNFNSPVNDQITIDQIRPTLRAISKEYGLGMIDGYATTANMSHLMPDGVHANDEGFRIIAEKVASILKTPKPVITINGNPSPSVYAEYRWYRNGTFISGATGSSHIASQPGTYKVAVKLSAGTDDVIVSKDIEVTESGIKLVVSDGNPTSVPVLDTNAIKVNNFSNRILIENAAGTNFVLFDMYGRKIKSDKIQTTHTNIDINDLVSGIYLYKVGKSSGKFLKVNN